MTTQSKPVNPLRDEPLFTTILDTANDIARARGYQVTLTAGQCGLVVDAIYIINRTRAEMVKGLSKAT